MNGVLGSLKSMYRIIGPAEQLRYLAILLAVVGAIALAFGAQFQNSAADKGDKKKSPVGLQFKQLIQLVTKPRWLSGFGLIAVAMVLQLAALSLAPLIVVQPIGAIALVITSLLNARSTKVKLTKGTWISIALCTVGIAVFVVVASGVAHQTTLSDDDLWTILAILFTLLAVFAITFFASGKKAKPLTYIVGAGVLYGFVATLAKVVMVRIYSLQFDWLSILCLVALVAAVSLGGWFVQNAYASGPPDLVIAGLTVIDPMVAVGIAVAILGEARDASPATILSFAVSAAMAVAGVVTLSRVHPEVSGNSSQNG
ncbi:MAG: DMT family transporter [Rhodoluna sp.]